ncbi:metal dependent phosphohydrolase [Alkaliphilus metalliredigens QYMF]|uniref:Metal dependent phosphohydrolase n=2 Tax=Alkaliphilus TaxID=114627 RepID=A6TMR2_ALKMQ|nr:metal dependent phosphohydrolase [Alkaliphilus metalliredigens QYMF]
MKNIKRVTLTAISIVVSIIVVTIFVHIYYVDNTTAQTERLFQIQGAIGDKYIQMNLPIAVLNNIANQRESLAEMEIARQKNLLEAQERNVHLIRDNINEMKVLAAQGRGILNDLEKSKVLRFLILENELKLGLEQLMLRFDEYEVRFSEYSSLDTEELSSFIIATEELYQDTSSIIAGLESGSRELERRFRRGYISFVNTALALLFIFILILVALIIRILKIDANYVFESLKKLNDHCYTEDGLPKLTPYFEEEKKLKQFVENRYAEQAVLEEIKEIASKEYILDDVLEKTFWKIKDFLDVDRIGVAFVDYGRKRIIAETGKINYGDIHLGPGFEVAFHETSLTKMLLTKKAVALQNLSEELNKRPHSPSLRLMVKEGIRSNMIIPLISGDTVFGFLFFSSFHLNAYDEKDLILAVKIAREMSTIIDKTYLTKSMLHNITLTFADLVEKKDLETGNHINRMTSYCRIIAEGLQTNGDQDYCTYPKFIHELEMYAPLHDIGKIGVPDCVLTKPGKLTEDEWTVMKQHTSIGAEILTKLEDSLRIFKKDFFKVAIDVSHYHHEKWDGSGYPKGLKGKEIPLAARIAAIADVFDALSSKRPYKRAFSFQESLEIIEEGAGKHFDPILVEAFMTCLPQIKEVYENKRDFEEELMVHSGN